MSTLIRVGGETGSVPSKSSSVVIRLFKVFSEFEYEKLNFLQGRLLTIVDAMVSNSEQKKAFKDLVKNALNEIRYNERWELTKDWYVFKDLAEAINDNEYEEEMKRIARVCEDKPSHQNFFA